MTTEQHITHATVTLEVLENAKLARSMTIRQTLHAIRSMGLSARWNCETREYRVALKALDSGKTIEESAYYTPDGEDAIGTAKAMLTWRQSVEGSVS